jgi:hypothetical protein
MQSPFSVLQRDMVIGDRTLDTSVAQAALQHCNPCSLVRQQ